MGAEQSRTGESSATTGGATLKVCYYELLGLPEDATDDEIKQAYRRKALELHPDRNLNDTENATTKFAAVQTANEILSDAQERAWYDSHRDSILRGYDEITGHTYNHGIRYSDASQIANLVGKFSTPVHFDDEPEGFFGGLQPIFEIIALEEEAACQRLQVDVVDYPGFGSMEDTYATIKPFYKVWQNFSTKKSFSWKDLYAPSDGPDRATRRLIDKENKKARDEAIRDFNDAIRHLVMFVRRRDPRWLPNSQPVEDLQKKLRDAAAAQAARSRAANRAKLGDQELPSWANSTQSDQEPSLSTVESTDSEVQEIECVPCRKVFKTEQQFDAHARSKKHAKVIQQIKKQMHKDNRILDLDMPAQAAEVEDDNSSECSVLPPSGSAQQIAHPAELSTAAATKDQKSSPKLADIEFEQHDVTMTSDSDAPIENLDSEYAPREAVAEAMKEMHIKFDTSAESEPEPPKLGKARAKRAKKAALQATDAGHSSENFPCAGCHDSFPSRSKLFKHIKEFDHAQPPKNVSKAQKKKSKR